MKDFALKVTVVFAILLAAVVIWRLRSIVGVILVSLAITAVMRAPLAYLMARGMRRGVAMLVVYSIALGALAAIFVILSYRLSGEFTELGENIVTVYSRLQSGGRVFGRFDTLLATRLPTVEELAAFVTGDQLPVVGQAVLNVTQNIGTVVGQFLLAMVLSIYWTADQVRFERFWLSLFPARQRQHAREVWHALEAQVGAYIRSEVVQSLVAGLLLAPGFWLLGMDYPVLWAFLIAVAWLIPLVGGLIFLIPLWLLVWAGDSPIGATMAVFYTVAVLAFLEFFVERRLYTQTRYTHVIVILVMLMLVSAYGLIGLLLAPVVATAIEVLLVKLVETTSRPVVETMPEIDVSMLRSLLEETRQQFPTMDNANKLRLANLAARLDDLLKQTEQTL